MEKQNLDVKMEVFQYGEKNKRKIEATKNTIFKINVFLAVSYFCKDIFF